MFNVKVEYECTPIRHIAVQCPNCANWFQGRDIIKDGDLTYKHDINWTEFKCPKCSKEFGGIQNGDKANVTEDAYPTIYDGCLERREIWV